MSEATNQGRGAHREAADRAGLRYVTDTARGIRRVHDGEALAYVGANGHPITSERTLGRIRRLAVPPGWTDVWICPDPSGHLQVTARDAKGRKQYRYHPKYRAVRDATKFDKLANFGRILPHARVRVETDWRLPGLPRDKVLATVVWLLEKTLIRVGNAEYARTNETFGLTTLQDRHAEVSGSRVRFQFRGKSGKEHSISILDPRLARIVQRCQTLPGEELFQYLDEYGRPHDIDSGDVNDYLQTIGSGISAKDFRTWSGTMLAAEVLREMGPARRIRVRESNVVEAVDLVSSRLGNTRAVCRQYYIHPVVIGSYLRGRVLPPGPKADNRRLPRKGGPPRLRHHEREVLDFISEHGKG